MAIVARKKTSVPLFELMSRSRELVPDRRSGTQVQTPPEEAVRTDEKQARSASVPAKQPIPTPAPPPSERPERQQPLGAMPEPIVQTGDGRVRLSLNYVSSTVVLAGLLLVLIAAFVLGRKTASPSGPAAVRNLYTQVAPRGAGSYLVLAEVPGESNAAKTQAVKLDKYLYENGIPAEVEFDRPGGRYVLVSYQAFEDPNSQQALEHRQRVATLVSQAPVESALALPSRNQGSTGPWWITLQAD
jgi:hypothetical protein